MSTNNISDDDHTTQKECRSVDARKCNTSKDKNGAIDGMAVGTADGQPWTCSSSNHLEGMTVSTTTGGDDAITTITQSVDGAGIQNIAKNYFMNNRGVLKLNDRDNDAQWESRKEAVSTMIDCVLKDKMTTEAQKLGITYEKNGEESIVANFREIGKAWKWLPFDLT